MVLFVSETTGCLTSNKDNTPCNRVRATKIWVENNNIDCMNWPPLSSEFNPVENLWAECRK